MENEAHGLLSMPGVLVATVGAILMLWLRRSSGDRLINPV